MNARMLRFHAKTMAALLAGCLVATFSPGTAVAVPGQPEIGAGNPFVDGWYADPDIAVYDDTYWVYPTTSKAYGEQTYLDAFSSTDMVNWTKHSDALTTEDISWAEYAVWAPAPVERDGKYYLFFAANDIQNNDSLGGIGVAVADKPEGPYSDAIGRPLIGQFHNGAQPIDQDVFIDDDGQAYMYYGGWGHANVVKLNDDMTSLGTFADGSTYKEITPADYVEGSQMFKRDGKYYLMWSEEAGPVRTIRSRTPCPTHRPGPSPRLRRYSPKTPPWPRARVTTPWSMCPARTSGTSSITAGRSARPPETTANSPTTACTSTPTARSNRSRCGSGTTSPTATPWAGRPTAGPGRPTADAIGPRAPRVVRHCSTPTSPTSPTTPTSRSPRGAVTRVWCSAPRDRRPASTATPAITRASARTERWCSAGRTTPGHSWVQPSCPAPPGRPTTSGSRRSAPRSRCTSTTWPRRRSR